MLQDRTCSYVVDLLKTPSEGQASSHLSTFINDPMHLLGIEFDQLIYETSYTVYVRGITDADRKREGVDYNCTFLTLSCLIANNHDTSVCRPNAPKELSVQETKLDDDSLFQVRVSWAALAKQPSFYSIQLVNTLPPLSLNVSGNITEVVFPSVNIGDSYQVKVRAYTPAGYGLDESVFRTYENTTSIRTVDDSYSNVVFVIVLTLSLFATILGSSFLIYNKRIKRKRYEQRCQYFESLYKKLPITVNLTGSKTAANYVEDDWEIPVDRLLIGDILGEGAFGVVRQGLLQARTHEDLPLIEVAVKMLRDDPSLDEIRQFYQEIEMMKTVGQHIHIVSIIGCCTQTNSRKCMRLMLVTEYCALGDLQHFLRKEWNKISGRNPKHNTLAEENKLTDSCEPIQYAELLLSKESSSSSVNVIPVNKPNLVINQLYDIENDGRRSNSEEKRLLTANELLSFARQITMGMEFLAINRVVHRDLAARNVLVCSNRTIKISDFGLSRDIYEQNVYRKKGLGKLPIKWMALESLSHQVYTTQSDVWSFGVLLWEIVTLGGNPYPSIQTNSIFQLLRSGYRMDCPVNCSSELYDIMNHCWEAKPKDRPTFAQLHQRFDELLDGCTHDLYLNLDLSISVDSTVSTVGHQTRSSSRVNSDRRSVLYEDATKPHLTTTLHANNRHVVPNYSESGI